MPNGSFRFQLDAPKSLLSSGIFLWARPQVFCQLPLFSTVMQVMAFLSLNKGLKLNNAPPEMMKL